MTCYCDITHTSFTIESVVLKPIEQKVITQLLRLVRSLRKIRFFRTRWYFAVNNVVNIYFDIFSRIPTTTKYRDYSFLIDRNRQLIHLYVPLNNTIVCACIKSIPMNTLLEIWNGATRFQHTFRLRSGPGESTYGLANH